MRLLHIVGTMSAEAGGPAEVVRLLVELAPPDIASEVVSMDSPGDPALTSLPCPTHAMGPSAPPFFASKQLIPWLRANRSRFDGVLVHGLWTNTCYAAWRALAGQTPYVVFAHGMLDPYFKRRYPAKHAKKWIYWLLSQFWALRAAKRVLFTTAAERDLAAQSFFLHSWRPLVVPLGTTPAPQPTEALREAFLALCPQVRGQRYLLFLGRVDRKKGCDLLVDAFGAAVRDGLLPGIHLVVAGPDPTGWRAELEATAARHGIADRVHFPGMLRGDAKWGALHHCDAFILPSHQENFGIAVVEALACARPALLSDKINIAPDIAADGAGLMQPDTAEGAAALLSAWHHLPAPARAEMAEQALRTFAARYDMRKNTETILRVFERPETPR